MFKKKPPRILDINGQKIELQPKPSKGLGALFNKKKPPAPRAMPDALQRAGIDISAQQTAQKQASVRRVRPSRWRLYIEGIGAKHKGLEASIIEHGINQTVYSFIKRMIFSALMVALGVGLALAILLLHILGFTPKNLTISILLAAALAFAAFRVAFNAFLNFPTRKIQQGGKNVDRNILFAARDIIISLRSGMPLFNAIVAVSTGYGDTSKQFAAVVEKVQLGVSLEEAIDQTTSESKSTSFRRLMLQASVSIKAGVDVVGALQNVVEQITAERTIELRRYGQRLNAIAMFYMLFGVILPTMGIAVLTILTTFIALMTITPTLLYAALVVIFFLQVIFLVFIRSSRPAFTM